MKDNNNANTQFDNPEDILALLQDFQEDNIKTNSSTSLDTTPNNTVEGDEVNEHNDTMDDDLLALLDMITKQEDSESTVNNNILAIDEQSLELDDLTNDYNNDELLEFSKLWETDGDFTIKEPIDNEPIHKDSTKDIINDNSTPTESSDIGDIFADVLSIMNHEQDDDFISLDEFDKLGINNHNIDSNKGNQESVDKEAKKKRLFSEKDEAKDLNTDKSDKKSLFKRLFSKSNQEEADNSVEAKKKVKKAKKVKKEKHATDSNDSMEQNIAKKAKKKSSKKTNTKQATSKRKGSDKEEEETSKKSVKKVVKKDTRKTEKAKAKKVNIPNEESGVVEVDNLKPLNKGILVGIGVLVATIAVIVILGSTFYSESINNNRAAWSFDKGRYDEAYEVIQGQKITVDNKEIHEKITTVMYVNYFYNSYSSLYQLEMYPEALDSLLQGLRNYDRNIDNAKALDIEDDMNLVRGKILKELNNKYDLSEKNAVKLSKVDDKLEYSKKVHTIVGKLK